VERHGCTNCDIFTHTYDELECHRFSDDCGVRYKIYDDFLLIIIVVYLIRTFCDNDFSSQWRHQNTRYDKKIMVIDVIIMSQKA
jgi:hypothetical protein